MDNEVIGKEILGFITDQLMQEDDSLVLASLQGLCDEVMLPNNGFICVMDSKGKLVAAPDIANMEMRNMGITDFQGLESPVPYDHDLLQRAKPLLGILTYQNGKRSDIVASLSLGIDDLRLNIHQDTLSVYNHTRKFLNGLIPLSILISLFVAGLGFFTVDRIVQNYESQIEQQNHIIARKNKDLTDSIKYAGFLQHSYLPGKKTIEKYFPRSFALEKSLEMVSGDFFFVDQVDGISYFSVIDCTGHGVPGSLLSMIGYGLLEEALHVQQIRSPGKILDYLYKRFPENLVKEGDWRDTDGMDMAICSISRGEGVIRYAGARNPMLHARNGDITKYGADRYSIGMVTEKPNGSFREQVVEIKEGDMIYLFSDGYIDQFGGPHEKKYMMSRFKEQLLNIHHEEPEHQEKILEESLNNWMGDLPQIDDITVLGIKITPDLLNIQVS